MFFLAEYIFRLNMKGHSMTNPIIAADAPKPEVVAPAVAPATPQPSPTPEKPEVKSTSGK
jgi:hypothetical protein